MPGPLRVVLDTNVLLAGRASSHPTSPAAEILARWRRREFIVLCSLDTLAEYAEKLLSHGIAPADVEAFIRLLVLQADIVTVAFFHFRHYPVDQDDVMFLLCAVNGHASHLVSYDQHLLSPRPYYTAELTICEPLEFLTECRKQQSGNP